MDEWMDESNLEKHELGKRVEPLEEEDAPGLQGCT